MLIDLATKPLAGGPFPWQPPKDSKCAAAPPLPTQQWVDPDCDESNGIESADEPSMLRLDALMMTVQVGSLRSICPHHLDSGPHHHLDPSHCYRT